MTMTTATTTKITPTETLTATGTTGNTTTLSGEGGEDWPSRPAIYVNKHDKFTLDTSTVKYIQHHSYDTHSFS